MLEASRPARCYQEHWFFRSHAAARWSALAEEKALSNRHTIFVLAADGATEGVGVMWCLANRPGQTANLGWTWIAPELRGTALAMSLVDAVSAWAEGRGAVSVSSAADDEVEAEMLARAGFTQVGLTPDGLRPVFVRPCLIGAAV